MPASVASRRPASKPATTPAALGPQLPNPALAIAYDEARRYVQLRLRSLPHGGLRSTCTAFGFPYTTSVGLKTGSLQREEYRLVQKHLRVFGFETELVRLYVNGQLCEHYLFADAALLATLREQLAAHEQLVS
ncbi:hypothetical protein GCM10027346_39370 [Hymenobacter seoulensis]|uniref:Uncharacterized protein n=1 Tax=Hymenobacter guriensis TaxID=2793065 RepID=A0ABS0L8U1_9BACT|nr:hypothetical protein [Hymenobacter guriensis]MBG8555812.1 hypothetical protein [Hymenobacter guriensis]